jgi:hypothetical protein
VVTIDERSNANNVLTIVPDYFPEDPTSMTVRFLNSEGRIVAPPVGSEWRVTPNDTMRVQYWKFEAFNGGLYCKVLGPTSLTVALVRASDKTPLFGPFILPVNVTSTPTQAAVASVTLTGAPEVAIVSGRYQLKATAYGRDGSVLEDRAIVGASPIPRSRRSRH